MATGARPFGEYLRLKRPFVRALLASAAVAAAVTLAGCNPNDVPTDGRALAPLSQKTLSDIQEKNMDKESPILVRLFKEESELEVWKQTKDGQFALLKTYPICRWSGDLGPKKKEGDRQAPEGFYTITPGQMNPNSSYYLAFNTGFPNAYDRAWGYTGSELMVHGDCSSRGCYAMTDAQIQEIYALARESFFGGQKSFQLQAYPFRMTALNMAKHRNNPNFAFWKMLKEGYDHFEATKLEPKVAVCEKRYVFDAAPPDDATKPLSFNPRGACPAYQLDKNVAEAVLDHRRDEQYKMAQYIAEGVPTVPFRNGIDGGMNSVFASKLGTQEGYDAKGNLVRIATAPGSLPRSGGVPATTITVPQSVETAADTPDSPVSQGKPTSIAGLIGNILGGKDETSAENATPALRGTSSEIGAKPKRMPTATYRTASAPKQHEPAKPKAAVANAETAPQAKPAEHDSTPSTPAQPALRTAYSEPAPPPAPSNGLAGAQPVMPAGSFASRWSATGLR
jgi:murein L,D-transpeptidase YafK